MTDMIRTKVSKGFQTVLPSEIRNKFGGEPGDEIIWSIVGDDVFIHIRKKKSQDPLKNLIGAFGTESEDDATRNIDHVLSE